MADESLAVASQKRCPKCGETKTADAFYKNYRDGLSPYCKLCAAEYKRKGDKTKGEILLSVYPANGVKTCSKCRLEKPIGQFNRKKGGRPKPLCKGCQQDYFSSWYRAKVPDATPRGLPRPEQGAQRKILRWSIGNGERTCSKCNARRPVADFKGERAYCISCRRLEEAAMYSRRREHAKAKRAEYRKANLAKCREWARMGTQRRHALKLNVPATLTREEWEQIKAKHGNRCLCCGHEGGLTIDHIIPLSKGGHHVADNVQPLCGPCNSKKHTKTIDYRIAA